MQLANFEAEVLFESMYRLHRQHSLTATQMGSFERDS
jgi:hypothetical protein